MNDQSGVPQPTKKFVVGHVLRLDDLDGRWRKWLNVPDDNRGVVIYPDGDVRIFGPGRHCVLNFGERTGGRGIGLRVACISAKPFSHSFGVADLYTRDETFVKAFLTLEVEINAPRHFLEQTCVETGPLLADFPDPDLVRQQLRSLVNNLESTDLISGAALLALIPRATQRLEAILANEGVHLLKLSTLTFTSMEEELQARAMREEQKQQEHAAHLAEMEREHEARLAGIEYDAAEKDFERQLRGEPEPEVVVPNSTQVDASAPRVSEPVGAGGEAGEPGQAIVPAGPVEVQLPPRPLSGLPEGYLRRQVIKLITTIASMVAFTLVADPLLRWVGLTAIVDARGLLSALWVSALVFIAKIIRDTYSRLIDAEKSGQWSAASWTGKKLVDSSRLTDEKMRLQASQELGELQITVRRIWQNLLRRGLSEPAGRFRRLEARIEALTQRVQDPDFGTLLEQAGRDDNADDPSLLSFLAEVSEQANRLDQMSVDQEIRIQEADDLEKRIYEFEHRFGARQRFGRA